METIRHSLFSLFIILFCISRLVFPQIIYAEGEEGISYAQSLEMIDKLIEERNYTKALEALSVYMQNHPEQFDSAQKRVSKIMRERALFNKQAAELAEKMRQSSLFGNTENDREDDLDSQKMDIILSLEKTEINPAQEEVDLTNDARRTVRLSYYINRLNQIIAQGTALVEAGTKEKQDNYAAAFSKFQEGLALKTSESDVYFDGEKEIAVAYPESLRRNVENSLSQITARARSIGSLLDECQKAYNDYVSAVKVMDMAKASSALGTFSSAFSALAEARNSIEAEGRRLEELDLQAVELYPGLGKTSYITFSRCAVLGIERTAGSGMIGAIDAFFSSRIDDAQREVYLAEMDGYSRIRSALGIDEGRLFTGADFDTSFLLCENLTELAGQGSKVHSLYNELNDFSEVKSKDFADSIDLAGEFSKSSFSTALAIAKGIAEEDFDSNGVIPPGDPGGEYEKNLLASADYYEKLLRTIEQEKNLLSEDSFYMLEKEPFSYEKAVNLYEEMLVLSDSECRKKCGNAWSMLAQYYSDKADAALKALASRNEKSKRMAGGFIDSGIDETLKFYPSIALEEGIALESDINEAKDILSGYRVLLDGGAAYSDSNPLYSSGVANIDRAIAEIGGLAEQNVKVMAQARINVNEARKAENEASASYAKAVDYLNAGRFDEAREYLSEADEKYKKSLSYEDNDEIRQKFSRQISETDAQITSRQNEWVVTTVRSLIDSAYTSYYAGDFETARNSLNEAAQTWQKTQAEDNKEIAQLLGLVNNALEATGGTEIVFSDPLYKEMGTFLSNASLLYAQGENIYSSGQTEKGKKILEQAREEARKVQRAYPRNIEAFNINLLVNKIISPELYNLSIAQRIAQAETEAGSGNEVDMRTALTSLKKLQAVVPDNKDVEAAASKIESQIKSLAQSEQARKDRARSDSLVRQAQSEKNVSRAIELLDEALSLNRLNSLAKRLKDQIYVSNAAQTTVKNYLDDADEIVYSRAERLYNDGQKEQAQALINSLYSKNPSVAKVIRLRRRIENM